MTTTFSEHARMIARRAFRDFDPVRDMLRGIVAVLGTIALQALWRLISAPDWKAHKWLWIASVVVPIMLVFVCDIASRLIRAPWQLYQERETKLLGDISEAEAVNRKLSEELKTAGETNIKLNEALQDSGPHFAVERGARHVLRLSNLKGGPAHDIVVHRLRNGNMTCLEHRISYLAEGTHTEFIPRIESDSGHSYASDFRLDAFLKAGEQGKTLEEKTLKATIPLIVTCWDGRKSDITSEFEIQYDFITEYIHIILRDRKVTLRQS